jgi:uncharacterized membrane protein
MNKTRLEAFSDGVFAIIITIMVLELRAPKGVSWEAVKPLLPAFFSYLLSFVFVAIYWGNHHHLLHTARRVTAGIMWANMHLLFWLSMIPFATAWMGVNNFDRIPVAAYGALLLPCGLSYTLLSNAIKKTYKEETLLTIAIQKGALKGKWSVALYALSVPAALFIHTAVAAALFVAVATIWLIPSKAIEKAVENE